LVSFTVLGVLVEVLGHLGRELARGAEHQGARHPGAGAAWREARDHREHEGRGLAGAGLGDAEDVAPFEGGGMASAWIGVGVT
jgi:hypothetical protein